MMLFIYFRKSDKFAKNMCNERFYVGQGKGVAYHVVFYYSKNGVTKE